MKVHIDYDMRRQTYDIYILQHHHDGAITQWLPQGDTTAKCVTTREGEGLKCPSFTLDRETMDSFISESRGIKPASVATQAHLEDTIKTRDRLLALIEKESDK